MLKEKARAVALGVMISDLVLTGISLPVAYVVRHILLPRVLPAYFRAPLFPIESYLFLLLLVLPLWGVLLYGAGFYRSHRTDPLIEEIWGAIKVSFGGTAILALLVYGLKLEFVSRFFLAVFGVVNFTFLATPPSPSRGLNFRTVLLIGTGQKAAQLGDFVEAHPHWGFRVVGYLDDDNGGEIRRAGRWPCLGKITDLEAVLMREVVDELIFIIEKGR